MAYFGAVLNYFSIIGVFLVAVVATPIVVVFAYNYHAVRTKKVFDYLFAKSVTFVVIGFGIFYIAISMVAIYLAIAIG